MGAIHFSIDPQLAALLAERLRLAVFIETGTFKGDSAASVRPLFKHLHTCELSAELHAAAARRFQADPAVRCHHGSSPDFLRELAAEHRGQPVMYWLDAHWCRADHAEGREGQCPLLDELDAIGPLHPDSVVWIDDARYFLAPPPAPLAAHGWPSFQQVLERLRALASGHHLAVANDTLLFHPARTGADVGAYLREHGADWLALAHSASHAGELRAAVELLSKDLIHLRKHLDKQASRRGLLSFFRKPTKPSGG